MRDNPNPREVPMRLCRRSRPRGPGPRRGDRGQRRAGAAAGRPTPSGSPCPACWPAVTCSSRTCPAPARRRWPRRWRPASAARRTGSSSPPTCCRPTSPACRCGTSARGPSSSDPGPVFANVVVADEINRASPKTQSALLEVMEEAQVTVDGVDAPGARAVPGRGDAEPDRPGGHLPAARGAARPVPHADLASATPTWRSRRRSSPAAPAPAPPVLRPVTTPDRSSARSRPAGGPRRGRDRPATSR